MVTVMMMGKMMLMVPVVGDDDGDCDGDDGNGGANDDGHFLDDHTNAMFVFFSGQTPLQINALVLSMRMLSWRW